MTKKISNEKLWERLDRYAYLLGVASAMIENPSTLDKKWWMKAIKEVVYENKPVPALPER